VFIFALFVKTQGRKERKKEVFHFSNDDQLRHNPNFLFTFHQPRVHLTRQAAGQGRACHAPTMEGHVRLPLLRPSGRFLRRREARAGERRLLPDELRHRGAHRALPQSPLASNIADRVRGARGGVALPLLPPRRAARRLRPDDQRPRRAHRHGGADHRPPPPHRRCP